MRCIYLNNSCKSEYAYRNKYLQDTFHLFFYKVDGSKHLEFASIPLNALDIVMIYGHNNAINDYISNNNIKEQNILLITCKKNLFIPSSLKDKNIFVSKSNSSFTNLYNGNKYGFNFDVTDTEILLYRFRNVELIDQINNSFERVVIDSWKN